MTKPVTGFIAEWGPEWGQSKNSGILTLTPGFGPSGFYASVRACSSPVHLLCG